MTELLSDQRIDEALSHLPDWRRAGSDGTAIERTATLSDFPHAIQVVNRTAEIAENENHHPDIDIRWRKVTFRLSTHSHGGITEKDISLAGEIDGILDTV